MFIIQLWIILVWVTGVANASFSEDVLRLRTGLGIGDVTVFDSAVRPSQSVKVTVGLTVLSIVELNDGESTLSLNGKLTVTWDGGVSWSPSSYSISTLYLESDELWTPSLVVENSASGDGVIADTKVSKINSAGVRTWEPFFHTSVLCDIDLTYFPFDTQKCQLVIASRTYTTDEVFCSLAIPAVTLNQYASNHPWHLDPSVDVNVSNRTTSAITFYFKFSRISDHLRFVLFLPLVFLSFLSLMVFLLPLENNQKSIYCIILLVTIVVFVVSVQSYIPVSKNLPLLVVYMWTVFIWSVLCVVCACIVLNVHHSKFLKDVVVCRRSNEKDPETPVTEEVNANRRFTNENVGASLENGHIFPPKQLPPMTEYLQKLKNNKVRPRSQTSVKSADAEEKSQKEKSKSNLAVILDRIFFVVFFVSNIFLHVIFAGIISSGQ